MRNHSFKIGSIALLAAWAAVISGCGGNSTPVGIIVTPVSPTILLGKSQQFNATVTGASTSSVTWQICLPPSPTNAQPTTCTPTATGQTQLPSGYGTITSGANSTPGGFYTAPTTLPPTNQFLVVATSTIKATAFASTVVSISSGIGVVVTPATATIAIGENQQFLASINGGTASGSNVTWEVNGIAGGSTANGFICPSSSLPASCTLGEYFAPSGTAPGALTITAVSASDPSKEGTATVIVVAAANPTLTSMSPNTVGEGSVQQDVYLSGEEFLSTSKVFVGNPPVAVPTLFISEILLRATIPASLLSGPGPVALPIFVQTAAGGKSNVLPGPQGLTVVPTRPIVLASLPNTLTPSGSSANLSLIGGYFSPNSPTTVSFNGQILATQFNSSRQLSAAVPSGSVPAPGLYPVIVQNGDVVAPNPGISALNIGVEPSSNSIPTAPQSSFAVGTSPQGIAIDPSLGIAVVANKGSNNVSIINLATKTPVPGSPVTVGTAPTSVAIDDQLSNHIAVVTNSADNTVSVINLTTLAVTTLNLPNFNTAPNAAPVPLAIAINPLTHRGFVTIQQSNTGDVLDFTNGIPTFVESVGGTFTLFSSGTLPSVAIDPGLNWAFTTPGGQGTVNIVDLGHNDMPGDPLRSPAVLGNLTISASIQGIGINTETHQALLADPDGGITQGFVTPNSLSTFSLLDQTVKPVLATQNGSTINISGFTAAAVNPLENIGITVNDNGSAYVVDVANGLVLQTITGLNAPTAVAIDAVTNTAYVANSGNNTVSVVALSTSTVNPLQVVETSPNTTYVQTPNAGLTLSVVGAGFGATSKVLLDGTAVPTTLVSNRQLTAAVPASMLSSARGYLVFVQNSAGAISNVSHLDVIQPIAVGNAPVGVAVDNARDQAIVTNSGSGSITVVNLLTGAVVIPQSSTSFLTGANPFGVSVLPRLGLAYVVNHGTNNGTILDVAGNNGVFAPPVTVTFCSTCTLPVGSAINPDTALASFTLTIGNSGNQGALGAVQISGATPATAPAASFTQIDYLPLGLAIDPSTNGLPSQAIASVATAAGLNQSTGAGTSALDFLSPGGGAITRLSNLFLPTDTVFDPVSQVFLATDSTANNIYIVNPTTSLLATVAASINPTSLDYNYNTSALVTANSESSTVSVIDYVCPPNSGVNCPTPHVQTIFAAGSQVPTSAVVVGAKAVAIDLRLNLIVEVDQVNNRVLLVPLPH